MTTAELQSENPERVQELRQRQEEFAAIIGVDSESLRHLKFCKHCGGEDYEWNDWSFDVTNRYGLDLDGLDEADEYRAHFTESRCQFCDGTGFNGGSFELTAEEWQWLGQAS